MDADGCEDARMEDGSLDGEGAAGQLTSTTRSWTFPKPRFCQHQSNRNLPINRRRSCSCNSTIRPNTTQHSTLHGLPRIRAHVPLSLALPILLGALWIAPTPTRQNGQKATLSRDCDYSGIFGSSLSRQSLFPSLFTNINSCTHKSGLKILLCHVLPETNDCVPWLGTLLSAMVNSRPFIQQKAL